MLEVAILSVLGVAFVIAVVMSVFVRRHGEDAGPRPGWVPTPELFRDPGTDRLMRVWTDERGERHYIPD
jgi:hypothetical protein